MSSNEYNFAAILGFTESDLLNLRFPDLPFKLDIPATQYGKSLTSEEKIKVQYSTFKEPGCLVKIANVSRPKDRDINLVDVLEWFANDRLSWIPKQYQDTVIGIRQKGRIEFAFEVRTR